MISKTSIGKAMAFFSENYDEMTAIKKEINDNEFEINEVPEGMSDDDIQEKLKFIIDLADREAEFLMRRVFECCIENFLVEKQAARLDQIWNGRLYKSGAWEFNNLKLYDPKSKSQTPLVYINFHLNDINNYLTIYFWLNSKDESSRTKKINAFVEKLEKTEFPRSLPPTDSDDFDSYVVFARAVPVPAERLIIDICTDINDVLEKGYIQMLPDLRNLTEQFG